MASTYYTGNTVDTSTKDLLTGDLLNKIVKPGSQWFNKIADFERLYGITIIKYTRCVLCVNLWKVMLLHVLFVE